MSAISRSLRPLRRELDQTRRAKPQITAQFANRADRDAHITTLEDYRDELSTQRASFKEVQQQYLAHTWDNDADQKTADQQAEEDSELLVRVDKILSEVSSAIRRISEQRERERVEERAAQREAAAVPPAPAVKLPKLELIKFDGTVTQWQTFWDCFKSAVHENKAISDINKMSHLRNVLLGKALHAIEGLAATADNYASAIGTLYERFGQKQLIVDAHYMGLSNLTPASDQTHRLRQVVDAIEQHLNSLTALGEDTNHRQFVSMIKSKLPDNVVMHLEEQLDEDDEWDVKTLRKSVKRYVSIRESVSQVKESHASSATATTPKPKAAKPWAPATASALVSGSKDIKNQNRKPPAKCAFCDKDHWSDQCRTYPTFEQRKQRIMEQNLCFRCLIPGHKAQRCRKSKPCYYCKSDRHHNSLCLRKPETSGGNRETAIAAIESNGSQNEVTKPLPPEGSLMAPGETVSLQTALTWAQSTTDASKSVKTRIFFDGGSHRSYVTQSLADELKLKPIGSQTLSVFTFGSTQQKTFQTKVVAVRFKLIDGSHFDFMANVVPTISGQIPRTPIDPSHLNSPLLKGLPLADSLPSQGENIDQGILIGTDYYWDLVTAEKIELTKGLYLIGSKLGWILTGRHQSDQSLVGQRSPTTILATATLLCTPQAVSFLEEDAPIRDQMDLVKFWDLDSIGIKERTTDIGDEYALQRFNDTIQYENNRYYVTWPWKEEDVNLPTNYHLALGRLNSLIRRLQTNPELVKQYDGIIQTQLEKGIIEKVARGQDESSATRKHYIPHHAVITPEKSTTKVRIVYDGSAKTRKENLSLNECLYRGPVILDDVCRLLIRFRLNKVALVADIEKAFLQVGLQTQDRDVTRFLWLKDPTRLTIEDNLQEFRFARVPFGVISSGFLLAATIVYHLKKDGGEIANRILENIYVDNVICSVFSSDIALEFYAKAKELFRTASMNIREWASNEPIFKAAVPSDDQVSTTIIRVLGIFWDTISDEIFIAAPTWNYGDAITKRSVLKFTASVYDPLGLFCPTILLAKLFLQTLWKLDYDWDTAIPDELSAEWKLIASQITPISDLKLGRFIGLDEGAPEYELHCFCDASQAAYGICIYLRIQSDQESSTTLLFAKSRLAPLRGLTLPCLELLAVHIGSQGLDFVEKGLPFSVNRKFIWTDSQCVLHWLVSTKPLKVFVRNRIAAIKKFPDIAFRYVASEENPADIASRGKSAVDLFTSVLWWQGPAWLADRTQSSWPSIDFLSQSKALDVEDPTVFYTASAVASEGASAENDSIGYLRYSTFTKLLRITAWVTRYIGKLKHKEYASAYLSADEINEAKRHWIKFAQRKHFGDVFLAIQQERKHPLREQLGLWTDVHGLLRCGGRLSKANLEESAIHPILLPKKDHLTSLIIREYHEDLFHAGVSHTLAQIRNEYWIPAGRATVFKEIRFCVGCKRTDGGPYKLPAMPPLPRSRVTPSSPFSNTGLDYLGPLYVKVAGQQDAKKVWICLFTCMATRAVHLELVGDMTAEQFLLCLQRFIARRGKPTYILSDNALQFKLVKSAMEQLWNGLLGNDAVTTYVSNENIKWQFIVERAPWMGGFYERLVRLVKQCLRKTLGKVRLNFTQLQTLVTEIEAVINSRPLAYVGSDFATGQVITPAHFLAINTKSGMPPVTALDLEDPDYIEAPSSKNKLIEDWKRGQRHLEHFWSLWKRDYLLNLRERTQQNVKQPHRRSQCMPRINDVVLVQNDGPRGSWKLARIRTLIRGTDGEIRAAEVTLPDGSVLRRSLTHLYPLECEEGRKVDEGPRDEEVFETKEHAPTTSKQGDRPKEKRPHRVAAEVARKKVQRVLQEENAEDESD